MNKDTLKIQFNVNKGDFSQSGISQTEALASQFEIFNHIATHLEKYFDLNVEDIKFLILLSSFNWQNTYSIPMSHIANSLPQERLIMVKQIKQEALKIFKDNLTNSEDYENLAAVLENAFVYYMNELASR